jgi:predicted metal-dependent hydrolase
MMTEDEAHGLDPGRPPEKALLHPHGTGGWKLDYRVRTSPRALNVRLQLSIRDGLTVVVPRNYDLRRIPAIVEKKRSWIEANLRRFAEKAEVPGTRPAAALPEILELPALGETWRIEYRPTNTRIVGVLAAEPGRITVYGAVHDHDACREVLKRWLHRRTREELAPWLGRLAEQNGFKFNEALIRGQKTRWASCSSKGTINLSFKLLFLERDWVRCVLLHELCHTVMMNHSPRFWMLLSGIEPECRTIHKRMRDGWKRVPVWVE